MRRDPEIEALRERIAELEEQLETVTAERDEERERFHRHVEEMIEPKLLEQLETLREAAAKTLHEYDLWAEDANDGEFAIWSRDEFMESFMTLRQALQRIADLSSQDVQFTAAGGVAGVMRRIAREALNPASEPKEATRSTLARLDAVRTVVERYGRVWAKDTDYYAAAEVLGIKEPPDVCAEAGHHVCGPPQCSCGGIDAVPHATDHTPDCSIWEKS